MNTREAILEYLGRQPAACADELAEACSRTRADIQYHLVRLERAGVIFRTKRQPPPDERGRPKTYFALSSHQKPDNLALLAKALLKCYLDPSISLAEHKRQIDKIASVLLPAHTGKLSLTVQLNRLVKELSVLGYQPRWEARADGPEVDFRNCPYIAILESNPELCAIDKSILSIHLEMHIEQIAKIQHPIVPACRFRLSSS